MDKIEMTAVEVAKLLRKHLKAEFPHGKFSVRTCSTGTLDVYIKNEMQIQEREAVDKLARMYAGQGFDGMIDMRFSKETYLDENGFACGRKSEGTQGSGGVHEAFDDMPANAVTLMRPYTHFVFVR